MTTGAMGEWPRIELLRPGAFDLRDAVNPGRPRPEWLDCIVSAAGALESIFPERL